MAGVTSARAECISAEIISRNEWDWRHHCAAHDRHVEASIFLEGTCRTQGDVPVFRAAEPAHPTRFSSRGGVGDKIVDAGNNGKTEEQSFFFLGRAVTTTTSIRPCNIPPLTCR